jgi:hypothetical protein
MLRFRTSFKSVSFQNNPPNHHANHCPEQVRDEHLQNVISEDSHDREANHFIRVVLIHAVSFQTK